MYVHDEGDPFVYPIATALRARGLSVTPVSAGGLASLPVTLAGDSITIAGRSVGGILFRAAPAGSFSDGFIAADRSFCDVEVRATWLAALHLDSVFAVNRYDAAAWFDGARWPEWRRLLIQAGIPVSSFTFGDVPGPEHRRWYPYMTGVPQPAPGPATRRILGPALTPAVARRLCITVCGEVIAGLASATVRAAAMALDAAGVRLAEVAADLDDRILSVNTLPHLTDRDTAARAAQLLGDCYAAHLRRW